MITTILSDFSRVVLNPKDTSYTGKLNRLHKELSEKDPNYSFFEHFTLNTELLNYFQKLHGTYSLNIFTTGTVQNHPEVRKVIDPIFDTIISATDFSIHKNAPGSFIFVANKLQKKPAEMLFIDDKRQNVEAAQKAGLSAILYKNNAALFLALNDYIKTDK